MLASTLLVKKRDGHSLSDDEIRFLIAGFCKGDVADYQMSALAMAICLRGMDAREITTLTHAMLDSGDRLPRFDAIPSDSSPAQSGDAKPRVDKHSTGGLGDKISLILAPLLAACDVDVPMVSGRGLGLTGGTLDKLEAIDGFDVNQTIEASSKILRDVGTFIISASERIAPADRRLYALRDVTGTVESIPLITASILSKKLAASLDALVMDVKTGSGAFMKTEDDAIALAQSLVKVGTAAGMPTIALLTDMDQPLGRTIGNAIEVNESVDVLRGEAGEVRELTIELCAELLVQVRVADSLAAAKSRLASALDSGLAMERFERMVAAQGGRLDHPLHLAPATPIFAPRDGHVSGFNSAIIGEIIVAMGGGRRKTGDTIDAKVGIEVRHRIGANVKRGEPIFMLHSHPGQSSEYSKLLQSAVELADQPVSERALIIRRIACDDLNANGSEPMS